MLTLLDKIKANYFSLKNIQIIFLKKHSLPKKLYNFFLYNKNFKLNINTYYYNNTFLNKNNRYLFNIYYRHLFIGIVEPLYNNKFKEREGIIEDLYTKNSFLKTNKLPLDKRTVLGIGSEIEFKKNIVTISDNILDILILYKLVKRIKKVEIKRDKKEANKRVRFKRIANKLFKHRFREEPKKIKTELLPKKKKRR